ncbi:MAG: polynucleotide kinase 3 phosphatase-domain-containing protein [Benniella sp.]|nr:MAG: polynucleotide kinase 3 phosphatase-domain-containing protein [Benniella sp.]
MSESSSSSKSKRRQKEANAAQDSSPPSKKPVYSIFEKKTSEPSAPAEVRWKTNGTSFIVGEAFKPQPGAKVAAYDLDKTLIKVNGNHKWPKNADDWVWWTPSVPKHLQKVADEGYTIVVITNQNGLDGNPDKQTEMRTKFEKICAQLRLPMWILISMQKDHNRKPMTGLWHWLEARFLEDDVEIDRSVSYFVGDAAGRQDGWKVGAVKDFNNTDRKFADTLNIQFHTPEHLFLNQHCPDDKWTYGTFDPKTWPKNVPLFTPSTTPLLPNPGSCEVIVFCGYPASGKSSFAQKHILSAGEYDYVNQDTLKTRDRCLKATEESLRNNRAVVVDNTNPDVPARAPYIALAKKYKVPVRCFLFTADRDLATHNNYFRACHRQWMEAARRERLPEMVFATYAKRYTEPTLEEGFTEIKKINFVPDEDIRTTWERWYY